MQATTLGYPRIGRARDLKRALESFWSGERSEADLEATASRLRATARDTQRAAGLDVVPCGDFSLYDHVLDTALAVGIVPERFAGLTGLRRYFAMARGEKGGAAPLEMTKWFDTNYHHLVPELVRGQRFQLSDAAQLLSYREASAGGVARPVLLGPVTLLHLSKAPGFDPLDLLDGLLPVYANLLRVLKSAGADWVQIDEPVLALDANERLQAALRRTYDALAFEQRPKLLLTSYFAPLGDNLDLVATLPVEGVHLDLVHGAADLQPALAKIPADKVLSLGVVDGRNVWRCDLRRALTTIRTVADRRDASRLLVAPSCSLLHVPVSLGREHRLDPELKSWLAFADEKLGEIATLSKGAVYGAGAIEQELRVSDLVVACRAASSRVRNETIRARVRSFDAKSWKRKSYDARATAQRATLALPLLPTTTIGSFPQTDDIRQARAAHRRGTLDTAGYDQAMRDAVAYAVAAQEDIGLDVLVHGEPERNDMVEFFGEQLDGFAVTEAGWVQSYGSRCVKPPILFGDVQRRNAMTVDLAVYAQSLSKKPVKGMLTGPVTILKWSFVRDDQPLEATCRQIAVAIRDEVIDLERAGLRVVQVDEAALREALPLEASQRANFLRWAVESFRIATGGVGDATQIHTHMCYAEFSDIMAAIEALDADVISIEAARSDMSILSSVAGHRLNEVGPGVYDIHSPRVPDEAELAGLIRTAVRSYAPERVWVNPDCGLKTRAWRDVDPALRALVAAAKTVRAELAQ
ncbi:5-methyltetrahydropteroyltriglutamate--homocysteine S-methyltransferase [Roseiterribacter gracilis]|uniref:5-methyltetrahydropteroyltriglutamate--homocysteine methyltransferase n=1 Tax=Roseiterribacter gracilis TaxID=2812848 RepID=A0A8S8XEY4_9PROT|nr:5-methyltetrahydropteroyltriglutamate--homocysteine methyltransferase [Rhodospirillales bacterium TMPK1]